MCVYYVVFGVMLNRGMPNFVAFLLTGLIPWMWFANGVNQAAGSILANSGLMLQVNIPKIFFPLEIIIRATFKHFFVVALLLLFLIFYPTPVGLTWLALPILMAIQLIYIVAFGTLCAGLIPFVPDLKFIVSTTLHLAMFASGVFYSIDSVILPEHRYIVLMNPMAGLLDNYREVLIYANWPDWHYLGYLTLAGLGLLAGALFIVFKLDHVYPRICQ
jgi:lipopolysaccharide transport system permease protein